ncbi:ribonuclease HI [Candidatus Persebacteraceae bacterium Df01]|jgi:ribonuclease HI|uniref:Ribonuclease H n=1 Tax=Candidatus Doriopsillibacter californiensis TaxID=2970740 RepID=A0ABT7QNA9_9GAMM|nr:ribonuclease HI [Candidatus Persebacteraceae bacterium Df01]
MSTPVIIYTDGACKGNPGPGGWGAVLQWDDQEKQLCGGEENTTNNRMEMTAVINSLAVLKHSCRVQVRTDSQYLQRGMTEWLDNWQRRGFRTASGKAVKNADLWRQLAEAAKQHHIEWQWVRGHADCEGNNLADKLANQGVQQLLEQTS